ncbi:hypothetical protein D0502_02120 [Leuconostoc falkenbergense]|uniref:Uncharacterized protein n=1 Tax=Leuconostoc falkenbergense TaxID=2766470 RepID=A0A9X3IP77_9LACO|nr:hypothetical protein [Leuconostoc falkenbergense]MCX7578197.1 hypothetical protein [Leuconostoc falkenbergense]
MTYITFTLNQNQKIYFSVQNSSPDYNTIIAIIQTNIEIMENFFSSCVSQQLEIVEDFNLKTPSFNIVDGIPKIYLCASEGNYWSQYVFQFSHELCHYFIDYTNNQTSMSTRNRDSWFEEIVCEVSSRFFLIKLSDADGLPLINYYLPSFKKYSIDRETNYKPFKIKLLSQEHSEVLKRFREEIINDSYANSETRSLYNHVANLLYPIFDNNTKLWSEVNLISNFSDEKSFMNNLDEWKTNCQINDNKKSVEDIISLFSDK